MEQFSDPNRARSIAKVRPRSNKHRPWSYLAGVVLALALLTSLFSSGAAADGTETLGEPSIPIASGNGTVAGGTGLIDQETGTITLDVPLGVSIEQVLLYWEGQAFTETSGFDDDIVVDGQTVEGVLIGGPTRFFSAAWSSTYRADITGLGLVDPGLNTIDVSGLDFDRRSNGAGILVITSDGGPNSTLAVRDGNDLAYIGFNPPLQSTIPQTVTFPPATTDRVATIDVFASSVAGDFEGERPNIILATVDGVVTQFDNVLNNTDGKEWDTVRLEVSIPAGATSLTLQLLSDDPATPNTGANPASLAWNAATFNIPTPREPGIDIEKLTNGNDADGANDGDVPEVAPGDPVTWTYLVTNTGDVAFAQSEVTVADDIPGVTPVFVASSDDGDGVLSPGETWTYEATGVADDLASPSVGTVIVDGCNPDGTTVPGDRATYENVGSVTVPGDSDSDPSHYCNPPDPGIDIEKLTNDAQADDADGADVPEVAPGDAVTWTYVVTNTGDVPFAAADVVVTDDVIGAITNLVDDGNGDGVLSPGEVWTYQATAADGAADLSALAGEPYVVRGCNPDGTTVPGDRATYENVGSVSVPGDSDSDPSHYCNPPDPGIDIEKLTNGNQADGANDGDVPEVAPGDAVTWTYVVTNTGEVPFAQSDVTVADDISGVTPVFVASSDDGDGVLSPGESWTYEATGVADDLASPSVGTVVVDGCNPDGTTVPGDRATYENVGSVSVPGDSDSDPSHYCNPPDPGIDIEKLTNGNQADGANDGDVPEVAPGDAVTWTYVVTNTGEVPFAEADVVVTDDIIGAISTIVDKGDGDGVLSPGESWTYEAVATGGAQDLADPEPGTVIVDGCNPDGTTVPGDRATYENIGTVTVPGASDEDPSHYCNPPDPGIDIEKLTNGNQADGANDGDVPEVAPGDAVTWTYVVTNTGEVPFAEADVVVTDDIIGAISTIVDKGDGDGVLSPGESWTYEAVATGGAQDLADPEPGTVVVDGCNPDGTTVPGDRATYENIGTVSVPGASDEDPSHYCNVLKPGIDIEKFTKVVSVSAGGDVCESPNKEQFGKPILITMRYNGEGADASNNSQGGKSSVSGDPNGASPVFIVASKNSDGGGEVFFSGTVQLGEAFVIDGNDGGNTAFGSATFITIYASQGGAVLQRVEIHTSCSAPLIVGEQFGSLILEGLEGEDGLVVAIPQPDLGDIGEDADTPTGPQASAGDTIQWTYLVSNTGDVSLTDVVVGDDNGTPGDTSDDFAPAPVTEGGVNVGDDNGDGNLDPGEVWVYRATGTAILGQYANISDVRAVPVSGGDEVTDTDPSHYFAVFGDDICEAFEKPVTLTMRYTGDGPDATSNSQDPGKVTVSGDPNDASPVVIAVNGAVVGTVELGETFEVVVDGSNTNVVISTPGGQQLQEVDFHTSCSQPLFIGDQFGALELVDSVDTNGQGPSNPNFTGVLVETREYKDDQVKIKLKNTGSTSVAINEIEISFPSDNGLLKKVKAGTDYDPNPDLGSPALILRSDFNDPSKVIVNAGGNRDIVFEFTDKNSDPAPSDYTIVIRLDDGTVLTL